MTAVATHRALLDRLIEQARAATLRLRWQRKGQRKTQLQKLKLQLRKKKRMQLKKAKIAPGELPRPPEAQITKLTVLKQITKTKTKGI